MESFTPEDNRGTLNRGSASPWYSEESELSDLRVQRRFNVRLLEPSEPQPR